MPATWKTVRVFISSTFRDMHAERDYLVKVIFPALREKLEKYHIHLVDIDLRWGITDEEARRDRVLDLCLEEIDHCRPFFVGILGERYGWVPQTFSEEALSKYGWVQHQTGKSVTELEILYGVLRNPRMHSRALFLFRDPAFVADVPEAKRADLEAEDEQSAENLRRLKGTIREAGLPIPPLESYPCEYAGLRVNWRLLRGELGAEGQAALEAVAADGLLDAHEYDALDDRLRSVVDRHGVVQLTGLGTFGRYVQERLWQAIQAEHDLPEAPPLKAAEEADPLAIERDYHERFMESRLRVYVGRVSVQERLAAFAEGDATHPCLVTGPSGSGKSAALAKFATEYAREHSGVLVIPHFVGASPGSTSLRQMLRRLCLVLQRRFELEGEMPYEANQLVGKFRDVCANVPAGSRVVLVLDALNQLDETDNAQSMYWLPWQLPPGVKIIASSIDDPDRTEPVLEALAHRPAERVVIEPLTGEERLEIVRRVPSLSAKTLDPKQVGLLLENPATTNPLFLVVALEELRGFGSFEELTDRIKGFPREGQSVTALFRQVIERLETEFGGELVRSLFTLLASAQRGLSELELQRLVSSDEQSENLFPVLRQMRGYLQSRGELVDFFHRGLYKAVREAYLSTDEQRAAAHCRLAGYFHRQLNPAAAEPWSGDDPRSLAHLPYHLLKSGNWVELRSTLISVRFLQAKVRILGVQRVIDDYDMATNSKVTTQDYVEADRSSLELIGDTFRLSADILSRDDRELAAQIVGRLMSQRDPLVRALVEEARASPGRLLPLAQSLTPPGGPLIRTYSGHTASVAAVAVMSSGRQFVSASFDSTLRVWNLETGEVLQILSGHLGPVRDVALFDDEMRAISASTDKTLRLWDLQTGELLQTLAGHSQHVFQVKVLSDGCRAISASADATLKLWDLESGTEIMTLRGHTGPVTNVELFPDGRRALSVSEVVKPVRYNPLRRPNPDDYALIIWDVMNGQIIETLRGHTNKVTGMWIYADGSRAVTSSGDHTLKVWDLDAGKEMHTLRGTRGWVKSVAVVAEDRIVSGASDGTMTIWDPEKGIEVGKLAGHTRGVDSVFPLPCRHSVISTSFWDMSMTEWDITTGHEIRKLTGHNFQVNAFAVLPKERRGISASRDGTLRLWDLDRDQKQVPEGHSAPVLMLSIVGPGSHAVSASEDSTLKIWDVATGIELGTLSGHTGWVRCVAASPNGQRVVSGSNDTTVRVWDLKSRKELFVLQGHRSHVLAVTVLAGGSRAVSVAAEKGVRIWDIESGSELGVMNGHTKEVHSVVDLLDGRRIVTGSRDCSLRIWDVHSMQEIAALRGHKNCIDRIVVLPGGERLVSASWDKTIKVWDLTSCQPIATFTGHGGIGHKETLAVSPDGCRLASAADDALRIWDLETGEEMGVLKGHDGPIQDIDIHPQGNRAVSVASDHRLVLWDLDRGNVVATYTAEYPMKTCSITPDGRHVVSTDRSGRLHFLCLPHFVGARDEFFAQLGGNEDSPDLLP